MVTKSMEDVTTPGKLARGYIQTLQQVPQLAPQVSELCSTLALEGGDEGTEMFRNYDWNEVSQTAVHTKMYHGLSQVPSEECHVLPLHLAIEDTFKQSKQHKKPTWQPTDVPMRHGFDIAHRHMKSEATEADFKNQGGHGAVVAWLARGYTERVHRVMMHEYASNKGKKTFDLWHVKKTGGVASGVTDGDALRALGKAIDAAVEQYPIVTLPVGLHSFTNAHETCLVFHRKYRKKLHRVYFFDSNNGISPDGFWKHRMFPSERHATWYLAHLLDHLHTLGFLQDVQDDFLFADKETERYAYWPAEYMISIPTAWTPEGEANETVRKIQMMTPAEKNVLFTNGNKFLNTERVRATTSYKGESQGFCVPLTLLLNVALVCFGEKALSNRWWNRLYLRVTGTEKTGNTMTVWDYAYVDRKNAGWLRGGWLAQTLMVVYLRGFMFRMHTQFGIASHKTVRVSRALTMHKVFQGNRDPVTFV